MENGYIMTGLGIPLILLFTLEFTVAILMLGACYIGMTPGTYHDLMIRKAGTGYLSYGPRKKHHSLTQPISLNPGPTRPVTARPRSQRSQIFTRYVSGSGKRRRSG